LEIAVIQFEANGVDKTVANILTDAVHSQLRKLPDARVISQREIETMLQYEKVKMQMGCTDVSCMVEIGGALGVDKLVAGSLGKLGDSYLFALKLLSIHDGKIEGMFDKRLMEGDEEDFLETIPEALATLFPKHALLWPKDSMKRKIGRAGPWPWVMVGVGGAAVITGGVMTYLARGQYQDWENISYNDPELKNTVPTTSLRIQSMPLLGR